MSSIKSGLAAAIVVASAGIANAADQVVYEPPAAEAFNWAGFYAGVHGGHGWGKETDNQSETIGGTSSTITSGTPTGSPTGPTDPADKFNLKGFLGGVHVGHNWQNGNFVFGVEGDVDYSNIKGDADFRYNSGAVTGRLELENNWQGSARLRAGYAIDNVLLYATGGIAFANADLKSHGNSYNSSDSNTHIGWTIGAGAEYAFTANWIARGELRYTDFQNKTYNLSEGPVKASWDQTTVNFGLSYKF